MNLWTSGWTGWSIKSIVANATNVRHIGKEVLMLNQPHGSTVSVSEQAKLLEKLPESVANTLIEHWNEVCKAELEVTRLEKKLQTLISIASMLLVGALLIAGVPTEGYIALIGALPALVIALRSNSSTKR
jgi:hypothetical protein